MTRFYDYWLKGIDNGIMDEPPIAIYVQRYDRPQANRPLTSGFWRYESAWPVARGREETMFLSQNQRLMGDPSVEPSIDELEYHPAVGTTFGMF
jgi:uncharacterized protein